MRNAVLPAICLTATLAACTLVAVTPAGREVRITEMPSVVAACAPLGPVSGSDHMNGGVIGQDAAESNAIRRVQNETAALGGDAALIESPRTGMLGSSVRGNAYRCGSSLK